MKPEEVRQLVIATLNEQLGTDYMIVRRDMRFEDGRNIILPTTTGTKFGTSTSQKIGFHGVDPVAQQTTIADASGCTGDADDKVNEIIDVLQAYGFIA